MSSLEGLWQRSSINDLEMIFFNGDIPTMANRMTEKLQDAWAHVGRVLTQNAISWLRTLKSRGLHFYTMLYTGGLWQLLHMLNSMFHKPHTLWILPSTEILDTVEQRVTPQSGKIAPRSNKETPETQVPRTRLGTYGVLPVRQPDNLQSSLFFVSHESLNTHYLLTWSPLSEFFSAHSLLLAGNLLTRLADLTILWWK